MSTAACAKNLLLDEKLRSLIRTSEINLTRIAPSSCTTTTTSSSSSNHSLSSASLQSNAGAAGSDAASASSSKHTITISITSSSASRAPDPSSSPQCVRPADTACLSTKGSVARSKKKKKRKDSCHVVRQQVIYAPPSSKCENGSLFRHRLNESSGDDSDPSDDPVLPLHQQINLPLPAVTSFASISDMDQDLGDLRMSLISQKWFLNKWIALKQQQLQVSVAQVRREVRQEREQAAKRSAIDSLLRDSGKRVVSSIRKGICCFCTEDDVCSQPSLPYTRHCKQHILYNVDQLLFTRCTVKSATSLTQCCTPVFDIERDEPVCDYHMRCGIDADDVSGKSMRKRGKQMALTRPARRKKKRVKDSDTAPDLVSDLASSGDQMPPPPPYPSDAVTSGIHAALDVEIPNLGPGDEALVASLVEDLGPLPLGVANDHSVSSFDAELTDVLNKMPADAFNELFADHPLKGTASSDADAAIDTQSFSSKSIPNGDTTYPFMSHLPAVTGHVNGHMPAVRPLLPPLPNDDLVNNILGFLTTEQQQQLNGLIDGALASGSLTSPTLKSAPVACLDMSFADPTHLPQITTASFKPTNQIQVENQVLAADAGHEAEMSAPFAQFNCRQNPPSRSPVPYPSAPFSATSSSVVINGLNESPIGRSNQFVRLSDMRLGQQATASPVVQSPIVKSHCIPRPVVLAATSPLPSVATSFEKKTS